MELVHAIVQQIRGLMKQQGAKNIKIDKKYERQFKPRKVDDEGNDELPYLEDIIAGLSGKGK